MTASQAKGTGTVYTKGKGQRAKGKGQRAEGRGQRAEFTTFVADLIAENADVVGRLREKSNENRRNVDGVTIECWRDMSNSIICERSFDFAVRILKLSDRLAERSLSARHCASQLVKCGTSIGSNAEEGQEGQTKPDYIAKMSVSRKEVRETCWWLRLIVKAGLATADEVAWELSEASQLLKMIRAAILKAKSSPNRGGGI